MDARGKWALPRLDRDALLAVLLVCSWCEVGDNSGIEVNVEKEAERIMVMVQNAYEVAMPRSRPNARKACY